MKVTIEFDLDKEEGCKQYNNYMNNRKKENNNKIILENVELFYNSFLKLQIGNDIEREFLLIKTNNFYELKEFYKDKILDIVRNMQ